MELTNYTIKELVNLRNEIQNAINTRKDGFLYINRIYSYGNRYDVISENEYTSMELSDKNTGDDGTAELYTNNPNINFYVSGGVYHINSKEEYEKWVLYKDLKNYIEDMTIDIEEWENRTEIPLHYRPIYEPIWTREELNKEIERLNELEKEITIPKIFNN